MKARVTKRQEIVLRQTLENLHKYNAKGEGRVLDIMTMLNPMCEGCVFVKYERQYISGGEPAFSFKVLQIDEDGEVTSLDEELKGIKRRYTFLGECVPFDVDKDMKIID